MRIGGSNKASPSIRLFGAAGIKGEEASIFFECRWLKRCKMELEAPATFAQI